jgi:cobalt-zinc-cadmium efflux system outer membrane protein
MKDILARKCVVPVLALSVLLPVAARGQANTGTVPDTITVDAVVQWVETRNAGLAAAREAVKRHEASSRTVASLPEPRLALTYLPEPIVTARGSQRAQVRVEQMFPVPGVTGRHRRLALLGADMANARSEALAADLILDAKVAYYDLHRTELLSRLIGQFEDELRRFEDVALAQYSVGSGMQQAVLKAQLERARLERVLLQLKGDRDEALADLEGLVGEVWPRDVSTVRSIDRPQLVTSELDILRRLARTERPEFELLRSESEQAGVKRELAERSRYPELGVNATYFDIAASDLMPTANGKDAFAVGATLKLPLNRGAYAGGIEEARLHRTEVEDRRIDLERRVHAEISGVVRRLESFSQQLSVIQDGLLPRAETTRDVTLSDYTNGRAGFLDLLDAERTLFQLRTTQIETHIAYLKAISRLERAVGVVDIEALSNLPMRGDENE